MSEPGAGVASRWYRPPTPTFYESVGEDLDELEMEGLHLEDDPDQASPVAWSPEMEALPDDSEDDLDDPEDVDEEDMHAYGIPAARGWRLDIRQSDTLAFKAQVLEMFTQVLALRGWVDMDLSPALLPLQPKYLTLKRNSSALTNAVFFVGYEAGGVVPAPPTVLMRVYGAGSEALLSRRTELLILHTLSSLYEIGPHILGTFANGRIEEFYECESIGPAGMRDFGTAEHEGPAIWVARRMRELHEVPLDVVRTVLEQGDLKSPSKGFGRGIENHIMAASHRPRRSRRRAPDATSPPFQSYSYFAHPSPGLFPSGANVSTMSFDSLATSYDSLASPRSLLMSPPSGKLGTADTLTMSPLALGPSSAPSPAPGPTSSARQPYLGVWRRLKRWTREASKVIEMVNAYLQSPEGQAVRAAYHVDPLPVHADQAHLRTTHTSVDSLQATRRSFVDMMACLHAIDLPTLCLEIVAFKRAVRRVERMEGKSQRVFCHNDSQYGNLLMLRLNEQGELPLMASGMPRYVAGTSPTSSVNSPPASLGTSPETQFRRRSRSRSRSQPPHHRLVVIDFEYATPNPRAYDIANHFYEWRANYDDPISAWCMSTHGAYPTKEERQKWLHAYVMQGRAMARRSRSAKLSTPDSLSAVSDIALPPAVTQQPTSDGSSQGHASSETSSPMSPHRSIQAEIDRLDFEVALWTPAVHAVWGLWGIVIARDDIAVLIDRIKRHIRVTSTGPRLDRDACDTALANDPSLEGFDNLRFGLSHIEQFREDLRIRHIQVGAK